MNALTALADDIGPAGRGPVVAVGGRTQWDVGGVPASDAREVRPPRGVVTHEPAEMTVRVRAGTTIDELAAALGEGGQRVALPATPGATVGGVLAVGHAGVDRLGRGPVRDTALELRYVSADGDVVKAGGPTVKNVSGFDLVRVLVGSLGTLGIIGEAVLRTTPLPAVSQWFASDAVDPWSAFAALHRPASILWDGTSTWVLLEGHARDVAEQSALVGLAGHEVAGPPPLPRHRWSLRPGEVRLVAADGHGPFVAEIGVGVLHRDEPQPHRALDPVLAALTARLKESFDPTGRLAPGRTVA